MISLGRFAACDGRAPLRGFPSVFFNRPGCLGSIMKNRVETGFLK